MRHELAKTPAPAAISDAVLEQRTIAALRERPQKLAELMKLIEIPGHQEYRVQNLLGKMRRERRVEFRAGPNLWCAVGDSLTAEPGPPDPPRDTVDTLSPERDYWMKPEDERRALVAADQAALDNMGGRITEIEVSASCDLRAELIELARARRTGKIDAEAFKDCYQCLNAASALDQQIAESGPVHVSIPPIGV